MAAIRPFLWFDGKAEEAASFYVSLLPDSRIDSRLLCPPGLPGRSPGDLLSVEFTLAGKGYVALDGGPGFAFTPAFSLFVTCDGQEEVDRLWDALLDGGAPVQCGWLTDRYGVSWQIVPERLGDMMRDPDPEKAGRVMAAMLTMIKLDLHVLEAAYAGTAAAPR